MIIGAHPLIHLASPARSTLHAPTLHCLPTTGLPSHPPTHTPRLHCPPSTPLHPTHPLTPHLYTAGPLRTRRRAKRVSTPAPCTSTRPGQAAERDPLSCFMWTSGVGQLMQTIGLCGALRSYCPWHPRNRSGPPSCHLWTSEVELRAQTTALLLSLAP